MIEIAKSNGDNVVVRIKMAFALDTFQKYINIGSEKDFKF